MENYYHLLEVDLDAGSELIRRQFQQKMFTSTCEHTRARLLEAVTVLLDPNKRRQFDIELVTYYLAQQQINQAAQPANIAATNMSSIMARQAANAYQNLIYSVDDATNLPTISSAASLPSGSEQRQFQRLSLNKTVLVDSRVEAQCVDISRGGIKMLCNVPLVPAQQLQLQSPLLAADGEVRSMRQEGKQVLAGIAFNQVEFYSHLFISTKV